MDCYHVPVVELHQPCVVGRRRGHPAFYRDTVVFICQSVIYGLGLKRKKSLSVDYFPINSRLLFLDPLLRVIKGSTKR